MRRLFTDGRIERVPAKRKVRAAVLLEVRGRFEPGRVYAEPEVNELLHAPERSAVQRQEIPAWESQWLQGFLDGR